MFTEQYGIFKELLSAIYQVEQKILIYVMVICVILLGFSYQLPRDEQGKKTSKLWAYRLFICIPLVFSMAALVAKIFSIAG